MARRGSIIFNRGELTDWLLANLGADDNGIFELANTVNLDTQVLLGDGIAPPAGGWPSGEPNPAEDSFVPYAVLATGVAVPSPGTPIGSAEADSWECNYTLDAFGGLRQQADWVADLVRVAWDDQPIGTLEFGSGRNWHVGSYRVTQMGAAVRDDKISPPLWTVGTQVALSISRRHGPA